MKYMLDLFSGLGGASEAFITDPKWEVLRIDNNPLLMEVPATVIMNINDLTPNQCELFVDLVWASPPCREFSDGYSSPKSKWVRENGIATYKPDMNLLISAIELIEEIKPKYWVIENVRGAIRYFESPNT